MTPYETSLCIKDYQEKYKIEQEDKLALTYLQSMWTAQWFSKKKPKSLDKILNKPKKKMTPEEMLEEIKRLNTSMGGTTY